MKEKKLLAFLGFPFYAYSFLNHFIAIWIPRWIKNKLNLYVGYNSTVKILAAIVLAPIAYSFQFFLTLKYISLSLAFINVLILETQAARVIPGVILTSLITNVPDIAPTAAELNAVG